jgi:hypothetical protein
MYIFKGIDERTIVRNMGTFSGYYFDCSRIDSFSINFLPEEMGLRAYLYGIETFGNMNVGCQEQFVHRMAVLLDMH